MSRKEQKLPAETVRRSLSAVLDYALSGGETVVTRSGRAVARVVPVEPDPVTETSRYPTELLSRVVQALRQLRDQHGGLIAQHGDVLDDCLRALRGASQVAVSTANGSATSPPGPVFSVVKVGTRWDSLTEAQRAGLPVGTVIVRPVGQPVLNDRPEPAVAVLKRGGWWAVTWNDKTVDERVGVFADDNIITYLPEGS